MEIIGIAQQQVVSQFIRRARTHPIEDVVVAFLFTLDADAGLFEQIVRDESTCHSIVLVEMQLDKLAKPTAVVVSCGFGVSKCFQ